MLRYAAMNHELPRVIQNVCRSGSRVILDYARENCNVWEADDIAATNKAILKYIPGSMCALKYTSFGSKSSLEIADTWVRDVIKHAIDHDVQVCIDAEEVLYPELCYGLMKDFNKDGLHVFKTYQMYRRDALKELQKDIDMSNSDGIQLGVKLVRGAYLRKQRGLFHDKPSVDRSFRQGLDTSLTAGENVHTLVATHNSEDIKHTRMVSHNRYKIAQLLHMGEDFPDYRYVPFGSIVELTPYLLRRLRERLSYNK
jgi:hydroxyproline oxidase